MRPGAARRISDDFGARGGGHGCLVEHRDHGWHGLAKLLERRAFERGVSQPGVVAGLGVERPGDGEEREQTEF
jgi:hypothetical protein